MTMSPDLAVRLQQAFRSFEMYYVYLMLCDDDSIYTGITTDVARRFEEHKNGTGGRYTRSHKVVRVIYSEQLADRSQALKREAEIKAWPKTKKMELIKLPSN